MCFWDKVQHDVYIVNKDQTQKEWFSEDKNRKSDGVNCLYMLCDIGLVI